MPGGGHLVQQRVEVTAPTMLRLAAVRKLPANAPAAKTRVALYPADVCAGGCALLRDSTAV
jgi:hypothetical protein